MVPVHSATTTRTHRDPNSPSPRARLTPLCRTQGLSRPLRGRCRMVAMRFACTSSTTRAALTAAVAALAAASRAPSKPLLSALATAPTVYALRRV